MKDYMLKVFATIVAPIMLSTRNYSDTKFENSRRIQFYKLNTSNIQAIEDAYDKLVKDASEHPDITVRLKRGSDDYPVDKASTYKVDGNTKTNRTTVIEVTENNKSAFSIDSL